MARLRLLGLAVVLAADPLEAALAALPVLVVLVVLVVLAVALEVLVVLAAAPLALAVPVPLVAASPFALPVPALLAAAEALAGLAALVDLAAPALLAGFVDFAAPSVSSAPALLEAASVWVAAALLAVFAGLAVPAECDFERVPAGCFSGTAAGAASLAAAPSAAGFGAAAAAARTCRAGGEIALDPVAKWRCLISGVGVPVRFAVVLGELPGPKRARAHNVNITGEYNDTVTRLQTNRPQAFILKRNRCPPNVHAERALPPLPTA